MFSFLLSSLNLPNTSKVSDCCRFLTGMYPSITYPKLVAYYFNLRQVFRESTENLECSCKGDKCSTDEKEGFILLDIDSNTDEPGYDRFENVNCPKYATWRVIGFCVSAIFFSLFVETGHNSVVYHTISTNSSSIEFIDRALCFFDKEIFKGDTIHYRLSIHDYLLEFLGEVGGLRYSPTLGIGTGSQVIVPSRLLSLSLEPGLPIRYSILEGSFILGEHRYGKLSNGEPSTHEVLNGAIPDGNAIVPSNIGVHSSLSITVHEKMDYLDLTATVRVCQTNYILNLFEAITASYYLNKAIPCSHDTLARLDSQFSQDVAAISIAAPKSSLVSIVMTKDNTEAQLLACKLKTNLLLATDCCLNCAYQQLMNNPEKVSRWLSRIIL